MKLSSRVLAAMAGLLMLVAAAGGAAQQMGEQSVRFGKIARIDAVTIESDHHLGLGAVIGGVAGGALGHQFGGGSGQTVMTVMGALGGGFAGNRAQRRYANRQPAQHIIVTLDNEVAVGITQPADAALRVGDRVRIDGSGLDARVTRP